MPTIHFYWFYKGVFMKKEVELRLLKKACEKFGIKLPDDKTLEDNISRYVNILISVVANSSAITPPHISGLVQDALMDGCYTGWNLSDDGFNAGSGGPDDGQLQGDFEDLVSEKLPSFINDNIKNQHHNGVVKNKKDTVPRLRSHSEATMILSALFERTDQFVICQHKLFKIDDTYGIALYYSIEQMVRAYMVVAGEENGQYHFLSTQDGKNNPSWWPSDLAFSWCDGQWLDPDAVFFESFESWVSRIFDAYQLSK